MDGSVFIFNLTPQEMFLNLNNQTVDGSIPADTKNSSPPYIPLFPLTIARSNTASDDTAFFINDSVNTLTVQFGGAHSAQNSKPIDIYIPISSQPASDLWLYIFFTDMMLFGNGKMMSFDKGGTNGIPVKIVWNFSANSLPLKDSGRLLQ
jgi:hypothetical protein